MWVHFRTVPQIATVGPLNIGMLELQAYEEDVEMTEEMEEELLRDTNEPGIATGTGVVMMGNPFMGVPTPQQQEFLEALHEGTQ